METLATLRHGLHETEERLLTKLRALRRDLRRTQGRADQDGSQKPATELTIGQRIADIVAATMGSWTFIIIQSIILLIWIVLNVTAFMKQWDPYPFILLNLALSFQAAYAAPFIMMSQNRQQDIDRQAAEHDHQINIKAELEIELLAPEARPVARDRGLVSHASRQGAHRPAALRQDRARPGRDRLIASPAISCSPHGAKRNAGAASPHHAELIIGQRFALTRWLDPGHGTGDSRR